MNVIIYFANFLSKNPEKVIFIQVILTMTVLDVLYSRLLWTEQLLEAIRVNSLFFY